MPKEPEVYLELPILKAVERIPIADKIQIVKTIMENLENYLETEAVRAVVNDPSFD